MSVDAANTGAGARHNPSTLGWMLPLLVGVGALVALAKLLAGPLVLPLLSLALVGGGFVLAAVLLLTGSRFGQSHHTAWAFAGALVFLGFAAALVSDGPEALAELERMQTHGIASTAR